MKTTSLRKVDVSTTFPGMSSRSAGDEAKALAVSSLVEFDAIDLDFHGVAPSPSFADQFLGGLAGELGLTEFRRRVRLSNVPPHATALLRHVILARAAASKRS